VPSRELIEAFRRDLAELLRLADGDLDALFRQIAGAEGLRDALMDVLPQLVAVYGEAAASLAADWYDEIRDADGAAGRFRAIPADLPNRERTDALARWGVGPLFGGAGVEAARSLVGGGFQRIVADAGRQTVIRSLVADPQGRGWRRETRGGCDFCKMIAGRGAVYSAETADFASHDDCGCIAVPVVGAPVPVKAFTPSPRR
jgi:hypothetical protein